MQLIKNAVGNNLYVFSKYTSRPSSRTCIIMAHGGFRNQTYHGPNVELNYYTTHGHSMYHISAGRFGSSSLTPVEIVTSKGTYDYILGKNLRTKIAGGFVDLLREDYADIENLPNRLKWSFEDNIPFDVVTLRNRFYLTRWNPLTLSGVIQSLWNRNYIYDSIHCLFCRGHTLPEGGVLTPP